MFVTVRVALFAWPQPNGAYATLNVSTLQFKRHSVLVRTRAGSTCALGEAAGVTFPFADAVVGFFITMWAELASAVGGCQRSDCCADHASFDFASNGMTFTSVERHCCTDSDSHEQDDYTGRRMATHPSGE